MFSRNLFNDWIDDKFDCSSKAGFPLPRVLRPISPTFLMAAAQKSLTVLHKIRKFTVKNRCQLPAAFQTRLTFFPETRLAMRLTRPNKLYLLTCLSTMTTQKLEVMVLAYWILVQQDLDNQFCLILLLSLNAYNIWKQLSYLWNGQA